MSIVSQGRNALAAARVATSHPSHALFSIEDVALQLLYQDGTIAGILILCEFRWPNSHKSFTNICAHWEHPHRIMQSKEPTAWSNQCVFYHMLEKLHYGKIFQQCKYHLHCCGNVGMHPVVKNANRWLMDCLSGRRELQSITCILPPPPPNSREKENLTLPIWIPLLKVPRHPREPTPFISASASEYSVFSFASHLFQFSAILLHSAEW